ncbi:MAG: glycoside hydrolase family 15 protein [Aquificota bacterium]|nr:MAG: glycoside hydrolase family 15 protein [Aquificota bacterium]
MRGDIDSGIGYSLSLEKEGEKVFYYYIVAGKSFDDLEEKNRKIKNDGLQHLMDETERYWNIWIKERKALKYDIPENIQKLFEKSLFIINAHIDREGAIIASLDSSIFYRFNKDHYSYSWPRDNAFIVMALDKAGFGHISRKFFEFASRTLSKKGYFLQKYMPDGSFGSSWHPWSDSNKKPQLPIQEDETALVIWALYKHYQETKNIEFIDRMYNRLVRPAADFMSSFLDKETGLPDKSYDPWEERRGILTYTCSTVYAGLKAASYMANLTGNDEEALKYEKSAEDIKKAILKHLYDEEEGRFLRAIDKGEDGKWIKDKTVDASLSAVFFTELLPFDDFRVGETMKAIEEKLWIKKGIGGVARFENDFYHRIDKELPGNPWIITTMWLADWYIEKGDFQKALELLKWVVDRQSQAGLLAEQYNPYTGEPLSVIPLAWSHAAFCSTVLKLNEKI